jgi:hypothetical protein
MTAKRSGSWFGVLGVALALGACGDDGGAAASDAGDSGRSQATGQGDSDAGSDSDGGVSAEPCAPDESAPVPAERCSTDPSISARPPCQQWMKIELPGVQCGNASQYKFFVNYSEKSNNVVLVFEGGGACWDFESCSGGVRGAANANGIPDTHMEKTQYLNLLRRDDQNPLKDWNMVFVPYCTGDLHSGSKVASYDNPDGGAPLAYKHVGHDNTMAIIGWMKTQFANVPKLLVTGYSAGGIGALQNYYHVREGLPGVQCSYLLNDSGPAFHSDGPSKQVQEKTRMAWGLDALLDGFDGKLPVTIADLKADVALLNTALADKYPSDRLSMTVYEMDLNYSLYSYERFMPGIEEPRVHELWHDELDKLLKTYDTRKNLAYYVPYFRHDNCSHCVSIPPIEHDTSVILATPWLGTEIEKESVNLRDFIELLLDDERPLKNYREEAQPDEKFTPEESQKCMKPT